MKRAKRRGAAVAERPARHLAELLLAEQHAEQAAGRKPAERPAGHAEAAALGRLTAGTAQHAADHLADAVAALALRCCLAAGRRTIAPLLLTLLLLATQIGQRVGAQELFE